MGLLGSVGPRGSAGQLGPSSALQATSKEPQNPTEILSPRVLFIGTPRLGCLRASSPLLCLQPELAALPFSAPTVRGLCAWGKAAVCCLYVDCLLVPCSQAFLIGSGFVLKEL